MLNINNKPWNELRLNDIEHFLNSYEEENVFFELKSDEATPEKLVREISAFANTYGGYVFLGINDNKTIGGCQKWNENRIHTTVHDCITPTPNFDVKKVKSKEGTIYIIKIEEGTMPPYITNKGQIFERVSSGSFLVKDSGRLSQLYFKRENLLQKTKNKIELDDVQIDNNTPNNLCGYIDLGFNINTSEQTQLQTDFYSCDLRPIASLLKEKAGEYSISRVGSSYAITIGELKSGDIKQEKLLVKSGLHNFIEVLFDGSVRSRIVFFSQDETNKVNIASSYVIHEVFKDVYSAFMGKDFYKIFINAQKYEKLTAVKQFVPFFSIPQDSDSSENLIKLNNMYNNHKEKYGNNLIVTSDRVPKNDYFEIDHRYFDTYGIKYTNENLYDELFSTAFFNLGYIDS